jgi:hypothetical protein
LKIPTIKLCDVKALRNVAFSNIDKEFWDFCEDQVVREEDKYWKKEGLWVIQPKLVINLLDSSESKYNSFV